jgi:hypothetical protein
MVQDIADGLFSELLDEGVPICSTFLDAVMGSYRRESQEALRRFKHLATMNDLPFDQGEERSKPWRRSAPR